MKQKSQFQFRLVENMPRFVVADPYYTVIEVAQMTVGILGTSVSILAVFAGDSLNTLGLGVGVICLLLYTIVEFTLVRKEQSRNRFYSLSTDFSEITCRISHHTFHPEGVTTGDKCGLSSRKHPPQMVWICTRCGEERQAEPGIAPE